MFEATPSASFGIVRSGSAERRIARIRRGLCIVLFIYLVRGHFSAYFRELRPASRVVSEASESGLGWAPVGTQRTRELVS